MPMACIQWQGELLTAAGLLAGQPHGVVFDYYLMVLNDNHQGLVALFVYIFLLCKRGRKSWLPLRDMNTVKQKSAQNPRSHRACLRQEVGPHCDRVSYSKFSAD